MTVVFCVVFCRLFGQDPITFAPYVLSGLAFWNFLSGVCNEGCHCFFRGERFIRQHPAPLAIYPLRTALGLLIHFSLALSVLLAFVWATQGIANLKTVWLVIPSLILLFFFGWFVALCMGLLNVVFQDTQHLITIVIQAMFYVTPIFYPPKLLRDHSLSWIADYNPLAQCLELLRAPILRCEFPATSSVAIVTTTTLVLFVISAFALRKMEKRLIFYL